MVPLDRALVSSYKLWIVTMSLYGLYSERISNKNNLKRLLVNCTQPFIKKTHSDRNTVKNCLLTFSHIEKQVITFTSNFKTSPTVSRRENYIKCFFCNNLQTKVTVKQVALHTWFSSSVSIFFLSSLFFMLWYSWRCSCCRWLVIFDVLPFDRLIIFAHSLHPAAVVDVASKYSHTKLFWRLDMMCLCTKLTDWKHTTLLVYLCGLFE